MIIELFIFEACLREELLVTNVGKVYSFVGSYAYMWPSLQNARMILRPRMVNPGPSYFLIREIEILHLLLLYSGCLWSDYPSREPHPLDSTS